MKKTKKKMRKKRKMRKKKEKKTKIEMTVVIVVVLLKETESQMRTEVDWGCNEVKRRKSAFNDLFGITQTFVSLCFCGGF